MTFDEPDERRGGRGSGWWLIAIGVLLSLAGCGVWMYVILRDFGVTDDNRNLVPGVSAPVVGFVSMVIGLVLASIGAGVSRSQPSTD